MAEGAPKNVDEVIAEFGQNIPTSPEKFNEFRAAVERALAAGYTDLRTDYTTESPGSEDRTVTLNYGEELINKFEKNDSDGPQADGVDYVALIGKKSIKEAEELSMAEMSN